MTITADQPATDAALLRAFIRTRDDAAFGRLVGRHAEAIRTVAFRNTGNLDAAEDVAQAAFLVMSGRAKQAMRSARLRGDVRPWLAKVTRYAAANWRKAEARRRSREQSAAKPERIDPSQPGELREQIATALSRLHRRDRRLIELHHLDGLSWPEVASRIHMTPDAARQAGRRAMDRLRTALERRGITASVAVLITSLATKTTTAKAASLPSASVYEIARGTIMTLKLQSAVATTAALLATAGLVTTAAALWQEEAPVATAFAGNAGRAGLTGQLSDGTEITIIAVGDGSGGWWAPNGDKSADYGKQSLAAVPRDESEMQVQFALHIAPREASDRRLSYRHAGITTSTLRSDAADGVTNFVAITVPANGENVALDVLVPVGEGQELARVPLELLAQTYHVSEEQIAFRFSPLARQIGGDEIILTVFVQGDLADRQLRVALAGENGETEGYIAKGSVNIDGAGYTFNFGKVEPPPDGQVVVRLQSREMVRFTGLAKRQGANTQPGVEVLDQTAIAQALLAADLQRRLDRPIGSPLTFNAAPLADVVDYLKYLTEMNIECDWNALAAHGVDRTWQVTLTLPSSVSMEKVIQLVASQAGLVVTQKNGTLYLEPPNEQ